MLTKIKNSFSNSNIAKFYLSRILLIFFSFLLKFLFIKIHSFELYGHLTLFFVLSSLLGLFISFRMETLIINFNKVKSIEILKQIQTIGIYIFLTIFSLSVVVVKNYYLISLMFGTFLTLNSFLEIYLNKYKSYRFNIFKILFNELNYIILIFLFFIQTEFIEIMFVYTSIIICLELLFLYFFVTKNVNFKINFTIFKKFNVSLTKRFTHSLLNKLFLNFFYKFLEVKYNVSLVGLIRFIEQILNIHILVSPFKNIILKNLNNFNLLKKKITKFTLILILFSFISLLIIIVLNFLFNFNSQAITSWENYFLLISIIFPLKVTSSFLKVNEFVIYFIKSDNILIFYSLSKILIIFFFYLINNLSLLYIYSSLLLLDLLFLKIYKYKLKYYYD